jgi:hypothetical protein
LARLIPITPELLLAARPGLEPPPATHSWKARRAQDPLAPWFTLTPSSPTVDERLDEDDIGVAASLELSGVVAGVLSPELRKCIDEDAIVLGGGAVARGTPVDTNLVRMRQQLRAQSTIRVRVAANGLASGRQCLLIVSLWATGQPSLQVFLGGMTVDEVALRDGAERLVLLIDTGRHDELLLDLWLRLSGEPERAYLAVRGVQGFLL